MAEFKFAADDQGPADWTLFLDDERFPTYDLHNVRIARDCQEAIKTIELVGRPPAVISFDHDLGRDADGKDLPNGLWLLKWLIDQDLDGVIDLNKIHRIIVHSANPNGAANIAGLWDGYSSSELKSGVKAEVKPRTSIYK